MAAAAANITKVNLELGGKAPAIVMADADLDLAVKAVKSSRVINSGQVCNCAERVYVQSKVADRVHREAHCRHAGHAIRQSPGRTSRSTYGPLINEAGYQQGGDPGRLAP